MNDLFSPPRPPPRTAAPPSGCQRMRADGQVCGSEGKGGNICFLSDGHRAAYCRDLANARMRSLVRMLQGQSPGEREAQLKRWLEIGGWSQTTVDWLRRHSAPRRAA